MPRFEKSIALTLKAQAYAKVPSGSDYALQLLLQKREFIGGHDIRR